MKLTEPYVLGALRLPNRMVMAPLTRCRATADHVPTDLMATYYAQRASAGLLITEGTGPAPVGTGYARIPGIYNQAQIDGWRKVTDAVHANGGRIFLQIMHTGRIGHPENIDGQLPLLAPSAVALETSKMYTDQSGELHHEARPRESFLTVEDPAHVRVDVMSDR